MYLTGEPIDLSVLVGQVSSAGHGAVVTFLGTVRDHHAGRAVTELEYQAYAPMAEAVCERILAEATSRWGGVVVLRHRVGLLAVGEVAVAVVAGAAHREAAFGACRYVIDEVKARVPIWKRERYADGSEAWVDPTAPGGTLPAAARQPSA